MKMEVENNMKISEGQKDKHCVFFLICRSHFQHFRFLCLPGVLLKDRGLEGVNLAGGRERGFKREGIVEHDMKEEGGNQRLNGLN